MSFAIVTELGVRVNPTGKAWFTVVDGAIKSFVGTPDEQEV